MRPLLFQALASAVVCASAAAAHAQYTIGKIVLHNAVPYAGSDILSTSGLKVGQPLDAKQTQAAAQKLMDTGAFDDVGVKLDGPFKSISVIFDLKPVQPRHMLRVSLKNFVWIDQKELRNEIHAKVPMFGEQISDTGSLPENVQTAVEEILAAKGIVAKVSHTVLETSAAQPFRAVEYSVDSPAVVLGDVHVTGASPRFSMEIEKQASKARGSAYNEGLTRGTVEEQVLAPYRKTGYLDARLENVQRTVVAGPNGSAVVNYSAALHEGEAYKVGKINWAGSPVVSAEEFGLMSKLKPGDVAALDSLASTLEQVAVAYRRKGYLDAAVIPQAAVDAASHQVTYTVEVTPGAEYHLRSLEVSGLTPAQRTEFDAGWRMHPGDVFDAEYPGSFLQTNSALRGLVGMSATYEVKADPEKQVADLSMHFVRGGNLRTPR